MIFHFSLILNPKAYSKVPGPINIIAVHWEALANLVTASDSICYNIASQSTKLVGRRTAELIDFLVNEDMATISNIHVLGHSLGAHCAGFTGKYLTVGRLGRITGGLLFEQQCMPTNVTS